ncbi:MAG: YdeI/OmpD-associated family protein [Tepidisphaeraceae bacterium]
MPTLNPSVDGYIRKNKQWQAELSELRRIILDCGLTEDIKWRTPCYTLDDGNVVFIGAFKDNCVLSFIKGALLKDPKGLLELPGENTQSARVVRITDVAQVKKLEPTLKAYIREATENERAGKKVAFKKVTEFAVPEELQAAFAEMPELKKAFESLTPGRQRGYLLHISSAKQSKTRTARIEKHTQRILAGKGLDDE